MARSQTVTISLDEYRELLLKGRPNDHDHEVAERMYQVLSRHIIYTDKCTNSWDSSVVADHMEVEHASAAIKELVTMLRYCDFERFMTLWNRVNTSERDRMAQEAMINQMREAKRLREEHVDES